MPAHSYTVSTINVLLFRQYRLGISLVKILHLFWPIAIWLDGHRLPWWIATSPVVHCRWWPYAMRRLLRRSSNVSLMCMVIAHNVIARFALSSASDFEGNVRRPTTLAKIPGEQLQMARISAGQSWKRRQRRSLTIAFSRLEEWQKQKISSCQGHFDTNSSSFRN